ncbi:MAG: exodeoxyribonuclease V subunit alpha [Solirubrobacteraceae bacterium]
MLSTADPFDVHRALGATGLLAEFNDAGVLAAADVHVARRLSELLGEGDDAVRLACALAVRAPRVKHVHVDLATIRGTATTEDEAVVDLSGLSWPGKDWVGRVAISRLVSDGPLRLEGTALYLDRYWREERSVASDLLALNEAAPSDEALLDDGLGRLLDDDQQALAAATAVRRRLAIVAGGPGTGKTTTVARILALLYEQTRGARLHVALAAPTGKAQSRLQEAVQTEARGLDVSEAVRERILELQASTLHRLLGWRPDSNSRFRHNRAQKLPHDVVIVDETSMVSLSQMARLVEAIRPDARLILVGDPGQLASIEAGAVLGDIVGAVNGPLREGIVVLERVHRFGGAIASLADAIRAGDADTALHILGAGHSDVTWIEDAASLREPAVASARAVHAAARAKDADGALDALRGFRILCAHRRDVADWTTHLETWLGVDATDRFYAGRPLLVTANDYELGLFNGDAGVIVAGEERGIAAFERGERVSPARLSAVDTAYAMTIHKAQGSQFKTAAVLLPDADARILTRELLYTAATRAQEHLILAGSEAAIRAAIARPIARASGLRARLCE